jgi:hypothetical protein
VSIDLCASCGEPVWSDRPYYTGAHNGEYAHLDCDAAKAEAAQRDALDRALAVDRSAWAVGHRIYGQDEQREEQREWAIIAIDWNRASGPLLCLSADSIGTIRHFLPQDVQHVPTSVQEIEAFLAGG